MDRRARRGIVSPQPSASAMPLRFLKFFSATRSSSDGFTQPQREALADALHFLVYADGHIAAREGEFVGNTIDGLAWDAARSFSVYEAESVARARQATENSGYRSEFLASIAARLDTPEARARALDLARGLAWSDGSTSTGESAALADLETALKG